jgi:hypothetical protein
LVRIRCDEVEATALDMVVGADLTAMGGARAVRPSNPEAEVRAAMRPSCSGSATSILARAKMPSACALCRKAPRRQSAGPLVGIATDGLDAKPAERASETVSRRCRAV